MLVNDNKIKSLNRDYRGKDKSTDVLSFPLYNSTDEFPEQNKDNPTLLLGDIVINPYSIMRDYPENKKNRDIGKIGIPLTDLQKQHLIRLLAHGLLHLIGYDHEKSPSEAGRMKRKEESMVRSLITA